MLVAIFNEEVYMHIKKVLEDISFAEGRDKPLWMPSGTGKFKTGSASELCIVRKEPMECNDLEGIFVKLFLKLIFLQLSIVSLSYF